MSVSFGYYLDQVIYYLTDHPLFILLFLFILFNLYRSQQKITPIEGSKVISIDNLTDLHQTFATTPKHGIVVVDFFAHWCGPCRSAAPVFGEWSKTFDEEFVKFCKVDVDKAREVATFYKISAMPTFKVFDNQGKELTTFVGWRQQAIQQFITEKVQLAKEALAKK